MYQEANIEISGRCNAKCSYCITGIENMDGADRRRCMSFDEFQKIYSHLIDYSIISRESNIGLYNWGEPYLNPEFDKICDYLSKKKQPFHLSTNGSFLRTYDKNIFGSMTSMIFSMCGFSQESYDKIHQFSFEVIKNKGQSFFSWDCHHVMY